MDKTEEKISDYKRNLDLLARFRGGDRDAGEELAKINMPLVYSIAARFAGRAENDDLIECGQIGLVKAMRTFDFTRECAFSTYAVPLIFGEMRRFLRDDGPIKVSREEKRLSALICAERERRIALGEDTSLAAIARAVGVNVQDAASAISSGAPIRSLDECVFDDDEGVTLGSVIGDEDEAVASFDKLALRMAVESLEPLHRQIVVLRYFKDLSQVEAAKILGLTQVKISREEKKIMSILKEKLDF